MEKRVFKFEISLVEDDIVAFENKGYTMESNIDGKEAVYEAINEFLKGGDRNGGVPTV